MLKLIGSGEGDRYTSIENREFAGWKPSKPSNVVVKFQLQSK